MTEEAASQHELENTPTQTPDADSQEGTPATEPVEGSEAPDTNWQERYANLQPEYTRATQEAAQYRQIIELARQGDPEALEYLGYEVPDADTDDDDADEFSTDDDRIARLEAQLQEFQGQREQQEQEARLTEAANRFYTVEFERLDPENEWSEQYRQLVAAVGDEFLDDDGLPQLEEAHKAIQAEFESNFKKRVESKRTPQAPSGASPQHNPDLDDKEQRREYLARKVAELSGGGPV